MGKKSGFVKFIIIFILVFFILVTALSMIVPYIGKTSPSQNTGDIVSGSGDVVVTTWISTWAY